jgi:hypothetical protein
MPRCTPPGQRSNAASLRRRAAVLDAPSPRHTAHFGRPLAQIVSRALARIATTTPEAPCFTALDEERYGPNPLPTLHRAAYIGWPFRERLPIPRGALRGGVE